MKNYLTILIILFLLSFSFQSKAQELTNYSLYQQNNYLFNPAITGNDGCINAFVNTRFQWVGINGAPAIYTFGMHGFLTKSMGLGIFIANDKHSNFNNLNAKLSYSYRVIFEKDHFLSFGAGLGIFNNSVVFDDVINYDPNDPLMSMDYYNKTLFSANAGIFYSFKKLELQFALPHLFHQNKANFFSLASIAYDVLSDNKEWDLKPMVMVQKPMVSSLQAEINLMGMWKETVWTSLAYRTDKTLIAGIGLNYKNIGIGYATQFGFSPYNNFSNGTHEIQLSVKFGDKICRNRENKTIVSGYITDTIQKQGINTEIVVYKNDKKVNKTNSDTSGYFYLELNPDNTYEIRIENEDYQSYIELLTIYPAEKEKTVNISLLPANAIVQGIIIDNEDNSKIKAIIKIYKNDTVFVKTINPKGNYELKLKPDEKYKFIASATGYITQQYRIEISSTKNLHITKDLKFDENKIGKIYVLSDIEYETRTSNLTKKSYLALDNLTETLIANPDMRIELRGHTDNIGSSAGNQKLSEVRAQNCYNYLISKEIDKNRLEYNGYGEKVPINANDTEENRNKNRRIEYKIIE